MSRSVELDNGVFHPPCLHLSALTIECPMLQYLGPLHYHSPIVCPLLTPGNPAAALAAMAPPPSTVEDATSRCRSVVLREPPQIYSVGRAVAWDGM